MLGTIANEKEVSRIAGTHWCVGTDEVKLARAAKAFGCMLKIIRRKNPLYARRELLHALKKRYPVLLCIDGWSHWITVVGAERGKFVTIDSHDTPVVCVDTWKSLKKRWVYREQDEDDPTLTETLYDLHILIPKFRAPSKAQFSLKRAHYLRRPENRHFATHWDEYFSDLSDICIPRPQRRARVISMAELLRRHGSMIRSQVVFWHGGVHPRQIEKILRNMLFVAETYGFVVRQDDEKRAITAITSNLTLWAAAKCGIDTFY